MKFKIKLKPIFKSIALTFITQIIVLFGLLLIYRLIANSFGPTGVGEYSLIKKSVSLLSPLLLLGLCMGIPRYIAMSNDKEERSSYMRTSLIAIFLTFIFLIFINIFKEQFAKIIFGNIEYTTFVLPFSFLLIGIVLHSLIYSYFRGRLLVNIFNVMQIINLVLVPLFAVVFLKNASIYKLISCMGIGTLTISLIFFLFFANEFFVHVKKLQIKKSLKILFRYSLPRIPGSFALSGFFSLGPILAAHTSSMEEVGYLSLGQMLVTTTAAAITPLGLILLPKVSSMVAQNKKEKIKKDLNYLIGASIQLSIFLSFQLIIFTDVIIKYWLGSEFFKAIPIIQIMSCSIFFYLFYRTVGSIIDATETKPINTINLIASLGVFLIISVILLFIIKIFSPIISLSIAFAVGLICLGILSYVSIRKLYPEKFGKDLKYFLIAVGINIIIGILAIITKLFLISNLYYFIIFEILMATIYLLALWLLKIDWIKKLPKKILIN